MKLGRYPQEREDPGFEQSQKNRKWFEQVFGLAEAGFDAATPSCNFVAFVVYEITTPSTGEGRSRIRAKQALTLTILPC